jgi:3-deoxy-manno-octulosonate cytidylyltransferase (CMP-KDO synthetase)
MIQRVYEGAQRSELINELVVATDDERIYNEVLGFGGKVMMTDQEHPSGTDRCAQVAASFQNIDVVINIQGDEPLVDFRQLEQLITAFDEPTVSIATLGNKSVTMEDIDNPNRIKIIVDQKDHALYFSRSAVPNFHHSKGDPIVNYPYLRHIGLYAYRSHVLQEITRLAPTLLEKIESLEQLRWLYYGYTIKIIETTIETPNIDVPSDVKRVLELIQE